MDRQLVSLVLPCRAFLGFHPKRETYGLMGRAEGLRGQGGFAIVATA